MTDNGTPEEDLTIGGILAVAMRYLAFLRRFFYIPLLLAVLVGIGLVAYTYRTHNAYHANLTFTINGDTGSSISSGGLLGQIGLGSRASGHNLNKILAISTSPRIFYGLILDTATVADRTDIIGNHILDLEEVKELDNKLFTEITFGQDTVLDPKFLGRPERQLLKSLYQLISTRDGSNYLEVNKDDITGIFELKSKTTKEDLSLALVTKLYQKISYFYTIESTTPKRNTVERLTLKADSIASVLSAKEYELASIQDRSMGIFRSSDEVQAKRLMREISVLTAGYGEIARNLEAAIYSLETSTPFFQVIDLPITPLPQSSKNAVLYGLLGAAGGAFLGISLLFAIRFVLDAFQKAEQESIHGIIK